MRFSPYSGKHDKRKRAVSNFSAGSYTGWGGINDGISGAAHMQPVARSIVMPEQS
jgi:hypothetical protein